MRAMVGRRSRQKREEAGKTRRRERAEAKAEPERFIISSAGKQAC